MAEITLNSGHKMPIAIFGTFEIPKAEIKEVIIKAVRLGYTHIDTAALYDNESEIGEALTELLTSGEKTRDQLYITTKAFMSSYRNIKEAVKQSLKKLQVTYIDQYLLHWPFAYLDEGVELPQYTTKLDRFPLHLVWAQMEALVDEGLVKSIGVSNWTIALLNDMLAYARIPPATNQFEINPYNKRTELIDFCLSNNIKPVAFKLICRAEKNRFTDFRKSILDEPIILELGQKYRKTPAQIIQSWCLSIDCAYIAKSTNDERIRENFESLEIKLEKQDVDKISSIPDQGEYLDCERMFGIHIFK